MATNNAVNDRTKVTETEVDFGSTAVPDASFTITDARVSASSLIIPYVSGNTPSSSRNIDEIRCECYSMIATSGSGSFTLYIAPKMGTTTGKVKVLYTLG